MSDRQADRVQALAAHVGGQSEAPRSVKVHPVHSGEVVTGDRAGRGPVPRSLRTNRGGGVTVDIYEHCPSCGHRPGCPCPEDCPAIAADEAARIADLDRWLGSRGDLEDSEVAAGAEAVFAMLDRSA